MRFLTVGMGPVSDSFIGFWDHTLYARSPCSALIFREVLNLIYHILLICMGDLLFPEQKWRGVDRGVETEGGREEGRENMAGILKLIN